MIVDADVIVVEDGAVDVSATVVVDDDSAASNGHRVDGIDDGGAPVHGAVFDHDHGHDHVEPADLMTLGRAVGVVG